MGIAVPKTSQSLKRKASFSPIFEMLVRVRRPGLLPGLLFATCFRPNRRVGSRGNGSSGFSSRRRSHFPSQQTYARLFLVQNLSPRSRRTDKAFLKSPIALRSDHLAALLWLTLLVLLRGSCLHHGDPKLSRGVGPSCKAFSE